MYLLSLVVEIWTTNTRWRIPKEQSKKDNPEKL